MEFSKQMLNLSSRLNAEIPQEEVPYLKRTTLEDKLRDRETRLRRFKPALPADLWYVYERPNNGMVLANNSVEGFHTALQNSVTNEHSTFWKLINLLRRCPSSKEMRWNKAIPCHKGIAT